MIASKIIRFSRLIKDIRRFFESRNCEEVILSPVTNEPFFESNLDAISFSSKDFAGNLKENYLFTSPELKLKCLFQEKTMDLFYLGQSYRDYEGGNLHSPFFTMLEFYFWNKDFKYLIDIQIDLIKAIKPEAQFEIFSMEEIFSMALKREISFQSMNEKDWLSLAPQSENLNSSKEMSSSDSFNFLLVDKIDPFLDTNYKGKFVFIHSYPDFEAALAKINAQKKIAERVELFFGSLELSNGFNECFDSEVLKRRFKENQKSREKINKAPIPFPEKFLRSMENINGQCVGSALGVERLAMALFDEKDLVSANPDLIL